MKESRDFVFWWWLGVVLVSIKVVDEPALTVMWVSHLAVSGFAIYRAYVSGAASETRRRERLVSRLKEGK